MTYFWQKGYPIVVQMDREGCPHSVQWDWFSGEQPILEIREQWVLSDPWEEEWRDYYWIITETGIALIIFLNRVTQQWFIQWVFD